MDGAIRALAAAAAVSLGALAAGCGSGDNDETTSTARGQNEPVGGTSESSPFRVGHEPAGYRLVQAGQGSYSQEWGEDSTGTDEPVTVLAPPGESPGGPGEVRVSVTGFSGYQGGLAQASRGYLDDQREDFELDGRPAIYMPAHEDDDGGPEPADLVAEVDDDLAVRVSAADASRDELAEIVDAVEPQDDHLLAPLVPDPPGDLQVVGSADADVAISLLASPYPSSESVPSSQRAHTAVWARGEESEAWSPDETMVVTTLPRTALDLDDEQDPEPPGFVVMTTTGAAATARLHVDDAEVLDTTLHPLPDDERRAGIFMGLGAHDWFIPDCVDPGEPVEPGTIELLDESDQRLPCST